MVAHSEILLSKCAQFREQGEFIDVRLKVAEDLFPAHRIVLAANSDYFHAMFAHGMKESNQEVIELKDDNISATALKIIMDSIYSGELRVDDKNVFEILPAADHLQVTSVVQQCCDYLEREFVERRFDVPTYCHMYSIADRHGLKDLLEATQRKMAPMFKEICETQEFLSHIDADQLSSLLSRDDLSAPSETFVFQSVMQWIKFKKEERMAVAAKVIGAVRLGLVDINVVIEELNTEEMQKVPEIVMLVYETFLHNYRPLHSSEFAAEKAKPRSMNPVLVAILPQTQMQYFDVQSKTWKLLPSMAQLTDATACFCAALRGNYLYVAAKKGDNYIIYRYHIVSNMWETLPQFYGSTNQIDCLCCVEDHIFAIYQSMAPRRYSVSTNRWQCVANLNATNNMKKETFCNKAAVVFRSCMYVLYGQAVNNDASSVSFGQPVQFTFGTTGTRQAHSGPTTLAFTTAPAATLQPQENWLPKVANMYCFDPKRNEWEQKASTSQSHYASSLFVVNDKLYVAGGKRSIHKSHGYPHGATASVEVYDEENNTWSVVEQKHIPPNNLGAVEIEGRVYFIINSFPLDSGIIIPPGDVYPVSLDEWENLGEVNSNAVLCYVPVRKENLTAEFTS